MRLFARRIEPLFELSAFRREASGRKPDPDALGRDAPKIKIKNACGKFNPMHHSNNKPKSTQNLIK